MRRKHHSFIFELRVGALKHRDYIIRRKRAHLAHHMRFEFRRQRDRMEVARLGIFHHFVEVHPGFLRQLLCHIQLNPTSCLQLRALGFQKRFLTRVGIAHYFPRIARHLRLVNQYCANRPFAGRFQVLINPASVKSERWAFEEIRIV